MRRKGQRPLHLPPAEFAEAAEYKSAVLRSLAKLRPAERERELARLNAVRYSRTARKMPRRRFR